MSAAERQPPLAVVIVNWNRPADTLECLGSLPSDSPETLKIILVDNGSSDDSVERISGRYPQVKLVQLPRNLGFSKGYNAGIQAAMQEPVEWVFLLNNDTVLEEGTIQALASADWDVAVPKIVYHNDPGRIWAAGCRWRDFPPSVAMIGFGKPDGEQYNQPRPLDYATGCALMVRREVLQSLGGFDPDLENYMEDYDFCYRLRQASFRLGYVPQARLTHKVSQTLGEYSPERWRQQGKNTVLFYRKDGRFPWWQLWVFLAWVSLREAVKLHWRALPGFWSGVREGLHALKQTESKGG